MSANFGHPSQPVFMVDPGRSDPKQHQYYHQQVPGHTEPQLVPCWTFPPARAEMKRRGRGWTDAVMVWGLIMILLLVFAALGLGAYQILRLQTEVERLTQLQEMPATMQGIAPERQVGLNLDEPNKNQQKSAAHLIGRADQSTSSGTLKWNSKLGQAFIEGVKYSNGGLQVNETGLYFVYSRVEFLSRACNPTNFLTHLISRQRDGHNQTIMEDHREGFCKAESPWVGGSHLGSLQHLKESDRLFVNVSHPHLLSKNFDSNYFGLFKIH